MGHTHLHKHLHMYHKNTDIPVTKVFEHIREQKRYHLNFCRI